MNATRVCFLADVQASSQYPCTVRYVHTIPNSYICVVAGLQYNVVPDDDMLSTVDILRPSN